MMKMKKYILLFLCFFCLCGCSHGVGKFEDGTMQLSKLSDKINQKSINGDWQFPLLNKDAISLNEVSKLYEMDMINIKECEVHSSLIPAQMGEIAFFHVEEKEDSMMKQAVEKHIAQLKSKWINLILEADAVLSEVKEGRIGEYYYVIVGSDAQKVVNYIQNMK